MTNTNPNTSLALDKAARNLADAMMTNYRKLHPDNPKIVSTDKLMDTVTNHALAAAAAGMGVSALPMAGSLMASGAMVTFIWSMYLRINECLGLKFSKVAVKTICSALVTNLGQYIASSLGISLLSSVISSTGIGIVPAAAIMGGMTYAIIVVSGILYLKLITSLVEAGCDPETVSEDILKEQTAAVAKGEDVKAMLKEQREKYKEGRKDGSISGNETVELCSEAKA